MTKPKPDIITPFDDKLRTKNLILEVIDDAWIYQHTPDSLSLDGLLFTLTLSNKKFVFEEIKVDNLSDYVDIYLTGIKIDGSAYEIIDNGSDIVVTFTESITLNPELVEVGSFSVRGKIVSR